MDTGEHAPVAVSVERRVRPSRELAWAVLAAIVSTLAAAWKVGAPASLSGLWGHYDYTTVYAAARTLAGSGWVTPNYDLGYPFVQDLAGFPAPDYVHLITLKVLTLLTDSPTIAVNAFLLLSFAAVAISGYALFRVVRVPAPLAFALAVSLALVPWHFNRFQHSFLANYSSVLLGLILVVAVLDWNLALSGPARGRPRDLLVALALACYVGLSGAYYAAFITILALVTLTFQILMGRRGRALIPAAWLGLLPLVVAQIAASSYRLMAVSAEPGGSAFARTAEESQMYAGALFTLLRTAVPWSAGFPIPGLGLVETGTSPIEGDAGNSTVGLIAVIVAFVVCGMVLLSNGLASRSRLVEATRYWPWLFMTSILFFVVSGFGQVFAIFFLFQIRSWGRFAIVVLAIAYVILGIALTHRLSRSRRPARLLGASVAVLLLLTAADLVSIAAPVDTQRAAAEADELRGYGAMIDAALVPGCGVFELPPQQFPEGVPTDGTATYDPLLPYLFSKSARWSYGGIRGTQAGDWHLTEASRHVPTLIEQTTAAGFCAIQVDTRAYTADDSPVSVLTESLGDPVAVSSTGRWQLFSLAEAGSGPYTRDFVLEPVSVDYGFGFAVPDSANSMVSADLGGSDGTLFVTNPRAADQPGYVQFSVEGSGCTSPVEVTVSAQGRSTTTSVTGTASADVQLPFTAMAGRLGVVHVATVNPCLTGDGTRISIVNPEFVPE